MSAPPGFGRTALVHDWLTGMRGGEKVLESLVELFPRAPIYTLFHFPGSVSARLERHPIHTSFLQRAPGVRRHYRRYLPLFPAAVEDFDLGAYDLVVSTSHCVAKGAIPAPDAFHVCYCHTPMRYAWDQEHAYFPRRRGVTARLRNLVLTGLRTWDAATVPRVDLFVANSHFVAQRIRRYYGRGAEVLPPPVDVELFTPGEETPPADELPKSSSQATSGDIAEDTAIEDTAREPYALAVSALVPYKRIDLACTACAAAGLHLKVVGTGPELEPLRRRYGGPRAEFLGRIGDRELRRLYRGAVCFVQPGVEDFGIAAVEALACGTPVVAQGRGGVLDIVEDGEHGVLYTVEGSDTHAPQTEEPSSSLRQRRALEAAIDKAGQIRFNKLNLRQRAEEFSAARFRRSFRALLESRRLPGRGSPT